MRVKRKGKLGASHGSIGSATGRLSHGMIEAWLRVPKIS